MIARGFGNLLAALAGLLTGLVAPTSAVEVASDQHTPVKYAIIPTGTELLTGVYADAHTYFLTRTLRPLNLHCVGSLCVDDEPADIKEALRFAVGKASLVIVTGGLGPTDDDVTRQTLAEFTGIPLHEQPDVLEAMTRRFRVPADQLRPNLRRQTLVPTRGTYLKSTGGTAVGLVFEMDKTTIVALPGPPRELQPMVRDELLPYLNRRFGLHPPGQTLRLRFVGVGQSQIDHTFKEHVPLPRDLIVTTQFEDGRVDFTFSFPHDTPENRTRMESLKGQLLEHLGDYVYAADESSLEQCVVKLLASRGVNLALAEAGSGGSLASALHNVADVGNVLTGAHVAPTDDQLRRLLRVADDRWTQQTTGAQRAECLAAAAAEGRAKTWTIAIGEAQQASGGEPFVQVVFRLPDGKVESQRLGLRGRGELARASLTTQLLDALRRKLR